MVTTFKRGDCVTTDQFPGVACWFIQHPYDVLDCEHAAYGEFCECEPEIDISRAIIVMVGDDHQHVVATKSLHRISEDDFCGGCGQLGCTHGR